ncbi:MAG: 3-dehydroquinate synthase, partial [Gemmatimonadetes bacterium]|nr:3-dehydroquinate synthase [Gemmatimonadota bacterium]
MTRVQVAVPRAEPGGYDVLIEPGLLARLPALLREHAPAPRYAVVTDVHVAPLYGEAVVAQLTRAGLAAGLHAHAVGDAAKTLATWSGLAEALLGGGLG